MKQTLLSAQSREGEESTAGARKQLGSRQKPPQPAKSWGEGAILTGMALKNFLLEGGRVSGNDRMPNQGGWEVSFLEIAGSEGKPEVITRSLRGGNISSRSSLTRMRDSEGRNFPLRRGIGLLGLSGTHAGDLAFDIGVRNRGLLIL